MVKISSILRKNLAIDLGTANTLVHVGGVGIVVNEPTYIELDGDGEVISLGQDAYRRYGKTPAGHRVHRPLKDGVIEDFDAATLLIRGFIKKARAKRRLLSPRVLIGIPSKMTQIEKRSVLEAARQSDIKDPYLIEETMAAAIGAGLDVFGDLPFMIVDIGGGTTEAAVIKKGAFVHVDSVRVAGDEMDYAIRKHLKENFEINIGLRSGEQIKWKIGSAIKNDEWDKETYRVSGKDTQTRLPKTVSLTPPEVRPALTPILEEIANFLRTFILELEPRTRDAISESGITLTGGGSLLRGMESYLAWALDVPVNLVKSPLLTVVQGAGRAIEELKTYRPCFTN